MMAAVTAAEYGAEVTIFEKNDRIGKKILATGNGKCNISNLEFDMDKYYCDNKEKLSSFFSVFSLWDTINFFESNGMMIRNKNGYLYPYSEQASTVLDIFRKLLNDRRIEIHTEAEVSDVWFQKKKKKFIVKEKGRQFEFDRVILSCGGPASQRKGEGMTGYRIAQNFGHTLQKIMPGLVQLRSEDGFIKGMAGVRCQAKAELYADNEMLSEEQGEVQFTEYGISGIPVFQFSRTAAYALDAGKKVYVRLNLFPGYEEKAFLYTIRNRFDVMQDASLEEFLLGTVNKKINQSMIKKEGLKPGDRVEKLEFQRINELMQSYRNLVVHIEAVNGMENAQICAGGVRFDEVDMQLASLKQPGLYLSGELLDVDGKCGGYNLQWAWTSGYIAGRNAAGNSTKELIMENGKGTFNAKD